MSGWRSFVAALSLIAAIAAVPSGASRADDATIGVIIAGVGFLTYSAIADPPQDREPDAVSLGTGVSDPVDLDHSAGMFQLEYRPELWGLRTGPVVGFGATLDGRFIGYAALRHDVLFADRLLVSFSLGLGAYRIHGGGGDLAKLPQFRTGFDIQYKLPGGSKVGIAFHHFSNAEVFEKGNPGTETFNLTYTIPFSLF